MSDNIKVVVKVRPLISREIENKLPNQWRVQNNTLYQLDSNGRDFGQTFTFDKVYNEATKTKDVYNDVAKPIVEAATAGINGTIFAYGQTSSGKTYTMTGTEASPGIIPLSIVNLFEIIKNIPDRDFLVRVSYIEIYNEILKDLLDVKKSNIKIHETYEGSIKVDVTEKVTSSPDDVLEAMREGEANRQTGTTNMNEKSSRSHSIFQITIESREHIEGEEQAGSVNVSQLNLVDLAGSERAGQTGATGIRFKEGTHINKSLSALALVIKQLSDDPNKYANYRDSKLTRILQNSLGGNAKTSIICAITPAALEETISTLQFATRAKTIKNKPEVNAVATDATMIQSLTKQLSKLQSQLEMKKNLEVILENKKHVEQDLQKQIANLQRLILNGFGQRSSIEHIGGTRRKAQQPRRVTISSLHLIDDDPVPTIPKFHTPSYKFNPMLIQDRTDFTPIESTNKLPVVLEEPSPSITPPPNDKKVNFNKEVTEIDSDDDSSTVSTCSPYHKCYNVSKTPPCVLRKNLNQVEKSYQEIIELTDREKMYKPNVVELMEKLEQSVTMTAKLQDELETFKKTSKDKDSEMEHLLSKIKKAEEEAKNAKLELETCCKNYDNKITDWEVSYEILKRKASLREEELLSLLEEQKRKKCEDIGKLPPRPLENDLSAFVDMSKDVSLMNIDNDSSTTSNGETSSQQAQQDLIASLQDQLIAKCQTIVQLEANIASQKQSIEYLEQSSHELQEVIDSFKEKIDCLENENELHKSTINTLDKTIIHQKENLEKAQYDMLSYNNSIRELQIRLIDKEKLLNVNINDSVLENMIANEEQVITNNEKIKNIITSFKIALDKRNKEIGQLKLSIQKIESSQNNALTDEVEEKSRQIDVLKEEISNLKEQVKNNISTINSLMREKSNLADAEQELTNKLTEIEDQNKELYELNLKNALQIENLKQANQKLLESLSESDTKQQVFVRLNDELQNKMDELSSKVMQVEEEIKEKNLVISALNKQNEHNQEYERHAKSVLDKLRRVISVLKGDVQEIPELFENYVILINALNSTISTLEHVATEFMSEKNVILEENKHLRAEICDLNSKFSEERLTLQLQNETIKKLSENTLIDLENLNETNIKNIDKISEQQKQIKAKCEEYDSLLAQFNICKETENRLLNEIQLKQDIILSYNQKESDFKIQIDTLEQKLKMENSQLQLKVAILTKTLHTIEELKSELKEKCEEVTMLQEKTIYLGKVEDQHIENILNKLCDIMKMLNIESVFSEEDIAENSYEHVLLMLDQIFSHTSKVNNSNHVNDKQKLDHLALEKEIEALVLENKVLKIKMSQVSNENKLLSEELEKVDNENNVLQNDLISSNELLKQLQEDLEEKTAEIECLENKAQECKDKFLDLDILMNQQMQDLRYENETIKARYLTEVSERRNSLKNLSKASNEYDINVENTCPASVPKTRQSLHVESISPPTLLTICCNKIVETLEPKQNDSSSATPSSSDTGVHNTANASSCSICDQLSCELQILQRENSSLAENLEHLELANRELIIEQERIRKEVQLLLEPAHELQKKISSHKTNLSILTATTYAENRSLRSQVKASQHYQNRLHNICQADIPEFKRQLRELFTMLKSDSYVSEIQDANSKRYSLPDVLDNNTTHCNFKNESTLDGDALMLDTNVTLTTTADNTLVGYDQTYLDLTQTMFNEASCQTSDLNVTQCNLNALVNKEEKRDNTIELRQEINSLAEKLAGVEAKKLDVEKKYNNLILEMPNTDALVSKLNALKIVSDTKSNEVTKLTNTLNKKNNEIKLLQEECDSLSTQVMENITEADNLNKELDRIKSENLKLSEKVSQLESRGDINALVCLKCQLKEIRDTNPKSSLSPHIKINRSLSDSDASSSYNKICTLQSEINASREDCEVLTEDVATIKRHLDCSNVSMDLDKSLVESNELSQTDNNATRNSHIKMCHIIMPDIEEECSSDLYKAEKMDCYNYYLELTGVERELLGSDVKIIDIMKLLYNNLLVIHGREVENLANEMKVYEKSRNVLQTEYDRISSEHSKVLNILEQKQKSFTGLQQFIEQVNSDFNCIKSELSSSKDNEVFKKMVDTFKLQFLNKLDNEFGMSSVTVFDIFVNKYENGLANIEEQCQTLQDKVDNLNGELCTANDNINELKCKLTECENECSLLKAQNQKMHEISGAITLDIVQKEQSMQSSLKKIYQKLLELNLITEINLSESANENINVIIEHVIKQFKLKNYHQLENEKEKLSLEVKESKTTLDEKEKELAELKNQIQTLRDVNNNVTHNLTDKEIKYQALKTAHQDLTKAYDRKTQESIDHLNEIDKLTEEIENLREEISKKESIILSLSEKDVKTTELLNSIKKVQEDNEKLKSINEMIQKERESYSIDLAKSSETIRQNNIDMEKMTSDILVLRESLKEATAIIESLKQEIQKLSDVNLDLKSACEDKKKDCARLEINMKTHEKTAEIQSKIIIRLQKQKEDDDRIIGEIRTNLEKINEKYNMLQAENEELKEAKLSLQTRISELEEVGDKPQLSLDAIADASRRRRQSIHDSKRILGDLEENRNMEALFESRQKHDDLFMDIDGDDTSGRSTPFGLAKGRDSLLSRTDQSDKDDEHLSRPSSVEATRRRRQSIHDMHRGVVRHTPSPHDLSSRVTEELHNLRDSLNNRSDSGELNNLREKLASCQQELEDLKEKYRELDEECETCAEYLREKDELCLRLKKEKAALEKQVSELKGSKSSSDHNTPMKPTNSHVAVNTDEDWANLHAVVVDRMSYDAEVDKNKRLSKTIEELRFQKQELKNTLAKMQIALEKQNYSKDSRELAATKEELKSVKRELEELQVRCKELDEECETCAEYLKEREEQCRKLKEAKAALEKKLLEYQEDAHTALHSHSVRKKRQNAHDLNRNPVVDQHDASTATNEDLLADCVERDVDSQNDKLQEIKQLRMTIEKLTHQKVTLEQKLRMSQATPAAQPMYVATGSAIVQNQQLTDVMNENQRLKKMNAKLVNICKKRGKSGANRENEDPCEQA